MSKYIYTQFVTPDEREKMAKNASGVAQTYFVTSKLGSQTPKQQADTLYSAIRDVEGNGDHPIVKALKNYMLSNGSTQEQIDDILKQGNAAYEASKEQPKAKVEKGISVPLDLAEPFSPLGVPTKVNSPELQAPVVSKPQPGEKGFTYQRVELSHQFEGNLLTTYIKVNPSGYARGLLSEKTRDEQANILYSAQMGGDSNVIKALEKHLINEKVFSPEQIESIKRAANQAELTISREQNEITAAVESGVSPIIKNSEVRAPGELQLVPFNVDNPEKSLVLASKLEKGNKLTFDEVLSKTGVVLSSSDQVLITEAFHKVGIMDIASKRNELLSEQITLTVATVVKNNPKLQPFVTEICDAFVDKATQDATRTALNGKFDPLKLQYQQQKKTEIEEELPSPDTRPRSNDLTGRDNPEGSLVLASKLEKGKKLTFDEILSKTGVVLSSSDQVLITEAFHKVGIIDRVPKRGELLSEQITLTVATVVKNNPKLQPFVTEICDAFVDKATQDATRTALNGKFDSLKLQYQQQKKTEIEEELPSPDTRPRSNDLTGRDDPRAPKVKEIEAQDSIILGSTTEKGQSKVTALSSSEVDPITEAIRKEILAEQQKLIQTQIALSDPTVKDMDPQQFRKYLTSDPGKEEAAKVFAKPEIQTALNKIEVEGYRKVHAEFSDSFKNVNWTPDQVAAAGQPKTKTSEITNEDGLVVAKIKETTHDIAPLAVTLDNGDKVNVKSYRTIDFPKELEAGKGPLHLSMAVKDQNGRNISEKEAVYFTAHYDEQGKLTEISSPIPVKFMGKGDDAVGYIERVGPDGKPKVYTLPVTQGKYKEMMKEVAKNQGMAVDLSQEVAQEAQDLALTKKKSRDPVLERDEEAVQPQKKTGRSEDLIALPETDAIPLQMVSVQGTAQDKTTAIDNMLRGVSPERIVATLKDQVAKGGSEAVGLIVEATKEGRTGDHRDVPTLTAAQFKEVYETGMNAAKVISDKRAPQNLAKHTEDSMRNIHSACNKLTKPAAVDPIDHMHAKKLHDRNFELKNLPARGR